MYTHVCSLFCLYVELYFPFYCLGAATKETQEDIYVASVETDRGVREQLRLYDTRGLYDGQELPKHYYSVADGFVLVYSVDSMESFKKVDVLKKEIDKSRDKKEVQNDKNMTVILKSHKPYVGSQGYAFGFDIHRNNVFFVCLFVKTNFFFSHFQLHSSPGNNGLFHITGLLSWGIIICN